MKTITYDFEDLPLVSCPKGSTGHVNGQAVVSYDGPGNWRITDVVVEVDKGAWTTPEKAVHQIITLRLLVERRLEITEAVREAMAPQEREYEPEIA